MGDSSERREAIPTTGLVGQGPNLGLAASVPILGFSRTIRYKMAFLRLKTGRSGPRNGGPSPMRLFLPIGIILSLAIGWVAWAKGTKAEMAMVVVLVLVVIVANIHQALQKPANPAPEKSSRRRRDRVDEQDFILVGLGRIEERLTQLEQRHAALALAAPSSNDKLLLEVRSALASL
ncbi:MAG: hypothetical protein RI910_2404, partial [Verrucomicrobiota bacterium]